MNYEWGSLLELQAQHVRKQDYNRLHEKQINRMLLRDELQKMIGDTKAISKNSVQSDKQFVNYQEQLQQKKHIKQQQASRRLHSQCIQNSHQNYHKHHNRLLKTLQEQRRQKNSLGEVYRRVSTEIEEERERQLQKKKVNMAMLSGAYNKQISEEGKRRKMEKSDNSRFQRQAKDAGEVRQMSRAEERNKIRFGYPQNPRIYSFLEGINHKKMIENDKILNQMSHKTKKTQLIEKQQRNNKLTTIAKIRETSIFNKNSFQNKIVRTKHQQQEQTQQINKHLKFINSQLELEAQQLTKKKQNEKVDLQIRLNHQIEQKEKMKKRSMVHRLSKQQIMINRSAFNGGNILLPGLSQDYGMKRQQEMVRNCLRHQSHDLF